jgi:hypothetical protein
VHDLAMCAQATHMRFHLAKILSLRLPSHIGTRHGFRKRTMGLGKGHAMGGTAPPA